MNVEFANGTEKPAETVVRAARGCYMTEPTFNRPIDEVMGGYARAGDVSTEEKVRHMIKGLLQRGHFGPFEHPQVTFVIEGISRVTASQLTRHRLATFDERSFRYTSPDLDDIEEMTDDISKVDKYVVIPEALKETGMENEYRLRCISAFESYKWYLEHSDLPEKRIKEDARYVLPKGLKTDLTMTVNARMLMHIADMRAAGDAQFEIRQMTKQILELAETWFPEAFEYYMSAMKDRKNRLAP